MYTQKDIMVLIIMSCRVSTPKAIEFRSKLRFKQHDIKITEEQSVLTKITKTFRSDKIFLQYSVLGYQLICIFPSIN